MPDKELAQGFLSAARTLCPAAGKTRPKQADLRRAVSSAYYAVFHELARTCADSLVGTDKKVRPNRAWVEVYRGLDHGAVRNACDAAANIAFPAGIRHFADAFKQLQQARHAADYDPTVRLSKVEALGFIALADNSILALRSAEATDKKAFAVWVLITSKGAMEARKRTKPGAASRKT